MMIGRLALVLVLSGCGRFGFQSLADHGGDPIDAAIVAGDQIAVRVTTDQYLSEPPGKPVAGATVLVDRAGGTDRLMTDAAGVAAFAADGALACHVIYHGDLGWRGYTVELPGGAAAAGMTIELGARPASNPNHDVTFALPASANAGDFTVRVPQHCANPPYSSAPSVSTSFEASCEGAQVRAVGFVRGAVGTGAPDLYLDAGMVTLTNHATLTMTGGYQSLATRSLQVTNLPANTEDVVGEIVLRSGLDLTSLTPTLDGVTPSGGTASLRLGAAPGGNAVSINVLGTMPVQYLSSSARIAPLAATTTVLDARDLVPLFASLTVTDPTRVRWTGASAGTITIVERNAGGVQWDWYLPPDASVATLPAIPADLGVPAPKVPDYASVIRLAVPGLSELDLLPTIDRRWPSWPHDPVLLPPAGSAEAEILYTSALGPPAPPAARR